MKIELNFQTEAFCLPGAVVTKLETASDADLRVLLLLAAREDLRTDFDAVKLSSALNLSEKEIEMSVAFWRGAGVLKTGRGAKKTVQSEPAESEQTPQKQAVVMQDSLPNYTGKELEALMKERRSLAGLLNECQKLLEKVFNVSESNKMIALVDYLHLPEDYVLLLCSYCKSRDKGSVAYVVSTAKALWNEDVVTAAALEEYIAKQESMRSFESFLRRLLGIGQRKLTTKEKRFFESWQALDLPEEVFTAAYESSVDATRGELSLAHLNKVLLSYKESGVRTTEDAAAADARHREEMKKKYGVTGTKERGARTKGDDSEFKSFDPDDFFAAALEKSKRKAEELQKAKQEEDDKKKKPD